MRYTPEQAQFLKENKIDSFKPLPFIPRDQQLLMVQYNSVRKFTNGEIVPILPRIEKEKFIIRQSKMNQKGWNKTFEKEQEEIILDNFNEFKHNTYK